MSSLMQFNGKVSKNGVHLQFIQVDIEKGEVVGRHDDAQHEGDPGSAAWRWPQYVDLFTCPKCGRQHPYVWIAVRKPRGTFGPWVVFMYNGEEHVPDLSCPISVTKIPRGAVRQSVKECVEIWHGRD